MRSQFISPLLSLGLLATAGAPHSKGQSAGIQGLAERETYRRQLVADEYARQAIANGAKAMATKDYESAFAYYKSAVDSLPYAPAVAELRAQALAGFSDATVKLAEQRISEGRFADAETTIKVVLEEQYNPTYKPALKILANLEKPDVYNKTFTPGFVGRVEEVKQLLREAQGYYASALYDKAFDTYEQVLNLDPYNIAARRGQEQVDNARQNYANAAYNQTRASMTRQVDEAWELPVKKFDLGGSTIVEQPRIDTRGTESINRKLGTIIIPRIEFRETTVREAIDFIKQRAAQLDTAEQDATKKGINIVLKLDPAMESIESQTRITLSLANVPLIEALRYIAQIAQLKIKVEPYAVAIVPLSEPTELLLTKEYRVPPDFIKNLPAAAPAGGAGGFAVPGAPAAEASRNSAKEYLEANGVTFPTGASANFLPSSSRLIIRNTQENLDLIDSLVENSLQATPSQIEIESKFVEISQNNLNELGFDWLLGQFALPFGTGVYGSGGNLGNQGNYNPGVYPLQAPGGVPIGVSPVNNTGQVTAGNRTGATAIQANAIDGLLFATPAGAAPGILSLAGVFTSPQFQVVIRALSQQKGVDIMTAPKVTTKPGKTARIEIIREFLYPSQFDPPQVPQTTGGSFGQVQPIVPTTPSAFEKQNLGVELEVQPTVGPDNLTIDLILSPKVTEFEGFINYGSPIFTTAQVLLPNFTFSPGQTVLVSENAINQPVFAVREIKTQVTIYDGQTVALGGLMREDIQKVEDKTPIIGDIPLVGRLFRTSADQHIKRNLIIFVTTKLIDPAGQPLRKAIVDSDEVLAPSMQQISTEAVSGDALSSPSGAVGSLPSVDSSFGIPSTIPTSLPTQLPSAPGAPSNAPASPR